MKKIYNLLATTMFILNCGRTGLEYPDSSNINGYTDDQNNSDASYSETNTEASLSASLCPQMPVVWPEGHEYAFVANQTEDLRGSDHQDVLVQILSPVMLETDYQNPSGVHGAVLYLDSNRQQTMVWYGHAVSLYNIETIEQNRCGYVYRLHIGFTDIGCQLRTCRSFNVGDRVRFQLDACSPTDGQCISGAEQELIGLRWN